MSAAEYNHCSNEQGKPAGCCSPSISSAKQGVVQCGVFDRGQDSSLVTSKQKQEASYDSDFCHFHMIFSE